MRAIAGAALLTLLVTAGCAHPLPALETPVLETSTPVLYIRESLPREAQICVVRNPWNDGTPACITVGDLRALIRARRDVALSGVDRP